MHEPAGLAARWQRDKIGVSVRLRAGEQVTISNTVPWAYELASRYLRDLAARVPGRVRLEVIGRSAHGRDILGLAFGLEAGPPAVLVVSGEHATEFAGQHAVRGIVEFLASGEAEARRLRRELRFLVVPQVNPDGNILASMNRNATGANLL